MFDSHLSTIYSYCLRHSLIRALMVLDKEHHNSDRTTYEIILIVNDLNFFAGNSDWLKEFGAILHHEQHQSYHHLTCLHSCCVYKSGWCLQLWFLSVNEQLTHFKPSKIRLFLDKDLRFQSEQIRIQAIKYHQWYELPDEEKLGTLMEDFYCLMLRCARLLKLHHHQEVSLLQSQSIEPFLIHLIQWINYCGDAFLMEEIIQIRKTMRDVTSPDLLTQKKSQWEQLDGYFQMSEQLLNHYSTLMKYNLNALRTRQLKHYFELIKNEGQTLDSCDKRFLIRL